NYSREYYCIGNLYRILDSMLLNSSTREEVQFDHTLLYVKNAIAFIKLNYSGPIRIDKLAYSFGLNRSYLTRLFKDATGYTLQEYVLIYRMKMATQLLLDTPESIQDIALAVGYTDTFTFSKAFKRHTGKSPSQYRAAQEADTPPADQTPPAQIS
nr:AraC family transcriptional regulator [Lachnospiraceae bacterium]